MRQMRQFSALSRLIVVLGFGLGVPLPVLAEDPGPLFDADGYRIAEFLAPVPDTCPGAATVATEEVRSLLAADAVPLDALPAPPRPEGLDPGALWLPPPRRNIPGSVWLPNVGYGRLSEGLERYLERSVQHVTAGDKSRKLVVYCRADCWMSWNLAKRLAALGYTRVYWYPDGTTGWEAAGLPLEPSLPMPEE
jgi:PQQ-dependent catabolism-associated CXXCW motif protein